jgi:hypothetical protein
VTVPTVEGLLTVPYVGLAEFKASPTWLDVADLVEGGTTGQQDAELYNQLLKASGWAEEFCQQPLHAHTVYENTRTRVDRWGNIYLHPSNNPVRSVTGLAFGSDFQNLQVLTTPITQAWVEDARGLVVALLPQNGSFMGSLQFGSVPSSGTLMYVTYSYIAGYANTYLTVAATSTQTQLTVADATGFLPPVTSVFGTAMGASVARIWDPAAEEAVTVSSSYVQGANPVLLSGALANNHALGTQVSEIPAEARQAVIMYTAGLLTREDASTEMPFPGSPGPTARRSKNKGISGGLIEEAERTLEPFRRVR